jgi:hypothetical protein
VLAAALVACIAAFGIAGVIVGAEESDSWFHLENEFTAPAYFSAALLLTAGAFAWLAARESEDRMRLAWLALAALWLVMGMDEVVSLHERIERRVGVDWQLLYLPVAAAGGVAWLFVFRGSDRVIRLLLALGAAAWVAAQVLENLQWDSNDERVDAFEQMMISEEILEMTGSLFFLAAVYLAWLWGPAAIAGRPARASES